MKSNLRMRLLLADWVINIFFGVAVALVAVSAFAEPYTSTGDVQLRHDIEYLADRHMLDIPITTWPISWADLSGAMEALDVTKDTPPSTYAVINRIKKKLSQSAFVGVPLIYGEVSLADNRARLRSFDDTARGTLEAAGVLEYTGNSFAGKLEVTLASRSDDDRSFRLDGSYVGYVWKNVSFVLGSQEKWWGPGHAGSLILSNNARPIPGVSIRRHSASRFKHPWLRWIGPWSAQVLAGKLESGRAVSGAYFLGARVVMKPLRSLELGVSRTAQWGGEGRPESFDNFIDLVIGQDNVEAGMSRVDEPGNQLAGFDARYSTHIFQVPLTLHGQLIGEDEAGGFPSRYMGQFGVSTSLPIDRLASTLRVNLEYSDTTCQFYEESKLFNCAYRHAIYLDGFRYRVSSIGHSTDSDSRQTALLMTLNTDQNQHWTAIARFGTLNRGGAPDLANPVASTPVDFWEFDFSNSRPFYGGRLSIGLGYRDRGAEPGRSEQSDISIYTSWSGKYP